MQKNNGWTKCATAVPCRRTPQDALLFFFTRPVGGSTLSGLLDKEWSQFCFSLYV